MNNLPKLRYWQGWPGQSNFKVTVIIDCSRWLMKPEVHCWHLSQHAGHTVGAEWSLAWKLHIYPALMSECLQRAAWTFVSEL